MKQWAWATLSWDAEAANPTLYFLSDSYRNKVMSVKIVKKTYLSLQVSAWNG